MIPLQSLFQSLIEPQKFFKLHCRNICVFKILYISRDNLFCLDFFCTHILQTVLKACKFFPFDCMANPRMACTCNSKHPAYLLQKFPSSCWGANFPQNEENIWDYMEGHRSLHFFFCTQFHTLFCRFEKWLPCNQIIQNDISSTNITILFLSCLFQFFFIIKMLR